jgi:hypothetical protein
MSERLFRVLRWLEHIVAAAALWNALQYVRQVGIKALLTRWAIAVVKASPGGKQMLAKEQAKTINDIRGMHGTGLRVHLCSHCV